MEYRGYFIEFNLYHKHEFTVQYNGDDIWFENIKDAMSFIDSIQ